MLLFRARQSLRAELEPPVVSRRGGIIVPLPGWLTGLFTRSDTLILTPRAAGAFGAAVLAATGVTAGLATSPPAAPLPRVVHRSVPAVHAPQSQGALAAAVVAQPLVVPTRPAARPGTRAISTASKPQRAPLTASAPTAPVAPTHRTEAGRAPAVGAPPRRLPPVPVVEVAMTGLPAAAPAISVVDLSPLPLVPLLEQAGAAAVAGAGGPPLPALPPGTLPPVP